jgi:hypothetical protein
VAVAILTKLFGAAILAMVTSPLALIAKRRSWITFRVHDAAGATRALSLLEMFSLEFRPAVVTDRA